MSISDSQRNEWARRGAAQVLQELDRQRQAILETFPELAVATPSVTTKRKLSAAHRRALSEGMRRHWIKRRSKSR
jgi:lipase chaperone LimK